MDVESFVDRVHQERCALKPGHIMVCGNMRGWQSRLVPSGRVDTACDCPYPSKLVGKISSELFVKLSADMNVFCGIDTSMRLWVWGSERSLVSETPQPVLNSCVDCSVGTSFAVAVNSSGKVFTVGKRNGSSGNPNEISLPKECELAKPVAVEACESSILLLCADGSVWSCGSDLVSGTGKTTKTFTKVTFPDGPDGPVQIVNFSLGSRHAGAVTSDGRLFVWGDGLSGNLGLGKRCVVATPTEVDSFAKEGHVVTSVGCTRGQGMPKRQGNSAKNVASGQEGPRTHVVTYGGQLWIAGTTHKGLGANHLNKTFHPDSDHLRFYKVGGIAHDGPQVSCPTGAAEDIKSDPAYAAQGMGMSSPDEYGQQGMTNYLSAVSIRSSCPAHIHSVALSDDGRAFSWGCGSGGRTGLRAFLRGPGGSKRTMKCYVSTPSEVEELRGKEVTYVTPGRYWSYFLVAP